jgi:hypothetical protein
MRDAWLLECWSRLKIGRPASSSAAIPPSTAVSFGGSFSASTVDSSYAPFLKHCVEMHGLTEDNASDCLMHFDLEEWALTLRK